MTRCTDVELSLGAYVLGALEPGDREEVHEHLARCAACRDTLAGLAGLPGLLGRLQPAEALALDAAPSPAPAALADRIAAAARAEVRYRHRVRQVFAAAAAAVVLAVGGTAVGLAVGGGHPAAPVTVAFSTRDPVSRVLATGTLGTRPGATLVAMRVSGVPAHAWCRLVAVGRDGRRTVVGSWQTNYEGGAVVTVVAPVDRAQLVAFEVDLSDGRQLVTVPVRA